MKIDWLFVVFRPVENISLILRRHHCRWRAANLDLCLALMAFSSEGSLACHTCCDTGHPFLRSSPRTRDIHTCCRAFGSGTVTTCVNDLGLSRPGFEHPTFRMRGERSTDWATAAVPVMKLIYTGNEAYPHPKCCYMNPIGLVWHI